MSYVEGGRPLVPETAPMRYHWFRDPRMDLAARGLLSYLVTHAPNYKLTVKQMIAETKSKRDAVYSALGRLVDLGYLEVRQDRGEGGTFGAVSYRYGPALYDQQYVRNWGKQSATVDSDNSDDSDAPSEVTEETAGQTASGFSVSGSAVSGSAVSGKPAPKEEKDLEVKDSRGETSQPLAPADAQRMLSVVPDVDGGEGETQDLEEQSSAVLDEILAEACVPQIRRPRGKARTDVAAALAVELGRGWHPTHLVQALSESFEGAHSVARVLTKFRIPQLGPPLPHPKRRPQRPDYVPGRPKEDPEPARLLAEGRLERDKARGLAAAVAARGVRRPAGEAAAG